MARCMFEFPKQLGKYPVLVREALNYESAELPQDILNQVVTRPLRMGCAIGAVGHPTFGSSGLFARYTCTRTGAVHVGFITCYHVLREVEDPSPFNAIAVVQPPCVDCQLLTPGHNSHANAINVNVVGQVANECNKSFFTMDVDLSNGPSVDAAFVCLDIDSGNLSELVDQQGKEFEMGFDLRQAEPISLEDLKKRVSEDRSGKHEGISVYKIGAKSGFTEGKISYLSVDRAVEYCHGDTHRNLMNRKLIEVKSLPGQPVFMQKGDSGCVVFMKHQEMVRIVGMGVAICTNGDALVTPIDSVLTALNVEAL